MESFVSTCFRPSLLLLAMATTAGFAGDGRVEVRPRVFTTNGSLAIEFWSGKDCVGWLRQLHRLGFRSVCPAANLNPFCSLTEPGRTIELFSARSGGSPHGQAADQTSKPIFN